MPVQVHIYRAKDCKSYEISDTGDVTEMETDDERVMIAQNRTTEGTFGRKKGKGTHPSQGQHQTNK